MSLQELNVVFHSLLEARLSRQRGEADRGGAGVNIAHSLAERLEIDAVGGDAEVLFDFGVDIAVFERDHSAVYRRQRPPRPARHTNIPVCLTRKIAFVPSSCCEMISDRRLSDAFPPALRMTCASPRAIPKALEVSIRASMHVTGTLAGQLLVRARGRRGVYRWHSVSSGAEGGRRRRIRSRTPCWRRRRTFCRRKTSCILGRSGMREE